MDFVVYLLISTVRLFLTVEQLLFLVRAILSWLFMEEDSLLTNFLYAATEPLVVPVRKILSHFESLQDFPIDISFMVTVLALSILQLILP